MPAVVVAADANTPEFEGKTTFYVILCAIISAFGGFIFGFDNGISGGVTAMDDFLKEFFPKVYERKKTAHEDNYCKYDDQNLQLFTSSLYLAALVASFVASKVCSRFGRRPTMQIASIMAVGGVGLTAGAVSIPILISGRILLGFGVGFANQAVPLFLSELAHSKIRGSLNNLFQLFVTIGILAANLVNYFCSNLHPNGWRVSLGIASVPAVILFFGSLAIPETPTSLIERQMLEQGKKTLKKIRGVENVDPEFDSIVHASKRIGQVKAPFRKLLKPKNRPPLVIAILLQVFQQFTGINAIMFYSPVLFQTVGFKNDASLLSAVITGLVNVFSTLVAVFVVDRAGRRVLLLQASVQMFITQTIIGAILMAKLSPTGTLKSSEAIIVVVLVCLFVMAFAWSWGPLGWLIPSETFPLETRSAGFSCAVSTNMMFTFIIAQAFLSMLCKMRAGIFFFFGAWILVMGSFAFFLVPETKGVSIDAMADQVWNKHWYWKRYMVHDSESESDDEESKSPRQS
ncbi:Sugar transport protein 8 [Ranunculus cassubicifolius]